MRRSNPKKELSEFKSVKLAIKGILRERRISYRELARMIGLSESGIKKIFAGSDCSFSRLSQISTALGFRLTDLLHEIDRSELKSVSFTPAQQSFFLQNPDCFSFFFKLAIERQGVAEIQKEFSLRGNEVFRYLKKLDDLKLIRLLPGNRVSLPPVTFVRDFGQGPLLEKVYSEWGTAMVKEIAHPKQQGTGHFIFRCSKMKDETYQEFVRRLTELEREFLRRSIREMQVSPSGLKPMRWMSLTDQKSHISDTLSFHSFGGQESRVESGTQRKDPSKATS